MGFINQLITGGPHIVGFILFTMGYAPLGFADLADGLRWEFETHNNTDLGHVEQSMDPILGVYKNHTDSIMYLKYRCIYMCIYIYVCVLRWCILYVDEESMSTGHDETPQVTSPWSLGDRWDTNIWEIAGGSMQIIMEKYNFLKWWWLGDGLWHCFTHIIWYDLILYSYLWWNMFIYHTSQLDIPQKHGSNMSVFCLRFPNNGWFIGALPLWGMWQISIRSLTWIS